MDETPATPESCGWARVSQKCWTWFLELWIWSHVLNELDSSRVQRKWNAIQGLVWDIEWSVWMIHHQSIIILFAQGDIWIGSWWFQQSLRNIRHFGSSSVANPIFNGLGQGTIYSKPRFDHANIGFPMVSCKCSLEYLEYLEYLKSNPGYFSVDMWNCDCEHVSTTTIPHVRLFKERCSSFHCEASPGTSSFRCSIVPWTSHAPIPSGCVILPWTSWTQPLIDWYKLKRNSSGDWPLVLS